MEELKPGCLLQYKKIEISRDPTERKLTADQSCLFLSPIMEITVI